MTSLTTHIVYADHVRRNELYFAGDNPSQLASREITYYKDVTELLGNGLMPIACSVKRIMASRGFSIDTGAIQEIQYTSPPSLYFADMQAFIVFNSVSRLLSDSRQFFSVVTKAGLL